MTSTRTFILGSLVAASLALTAAGCGGDEPVLGQDTDELTAAQCTFFAVGDRVQICHRTGSARNPYTIIRTSSAGCASGHSGHAGDYVTSTDPASDLYDPTCSGQGCFPIGAPYDGSVGCCEYLAPDGGVCADVDECATDNGGCDAGYACSNNVGAPPTCTEIDECAAGTDDCADHATCANTPGSFTCTCDAGYEGDGVTCTGIEQRRFGIGHIQQGVQIRTGLVDVNHLRGRLHHEQC